MPPKKKSAGAMVSELEAGPMVSEFDDVFTQCLGSLWDPVMLKTSQWLHNHMLGLVP